MQTNYFHRYVSVLEKQNALSWGIFEPHHKTKLAWGVLFETAPFIETATHKQNKPNNEWKMK